MASLFVYSGAFPSSGMTHKNPYSLKGESRLKLTFGIGFVISLRDWRSPGLSGPSDPSGPSGPSFDTYQLALFFEENLSMKLAVLPVFRVRVLTTATLAAIVIEGEHL